LQMQSFTMNKFINYAIKTPDIATLHYKNILFFADRLPPLIGGMEMHAGYFIEYFNHHSQFPIKGIVTKNSQGVDYLIYQGNKYPTKIEDLKDIFEPAIIFFNSGRWIEELTQLKLMFPKSVFIYRTGGNEILKAPLKDQTIANHSLRQKYWVKSINDSIDLLITNSAHTEKRLRDVGIKCIFERFVGGVNASFINSYLSSSNHNKNNELIMFCAARFVPYKNHALLLSIIHQLKIRGHNIRLRLAGDGPLFSSIIEQADKLGINNDVDFLGTLGNSEVCKEIICANIYIQLSSDYLTEVPGGSYVHSEGMGRSILEALTAGTFVIAGNSGALNEVISPDLGSIIEIIDIVQITAEIEKIIIHSPPKLAFKDKFCWNKIFKGYEQLFGRLNESTFSY
jgi:glycosyltransferase involved in cell wall biosynthesis